MKPLVKLRCVISEQKYSLAESEESGFLEVPLVLPLDSTVRQWNNRVITKVSSYYLLCWNYPQETQYLYSDDMLWIIFCHCFSSCEGRPLKSAQLLCFKFPYVGFILSSEGFLSNFSFFVMQQTSKWAPKWRNCQVDVIVCVGFPA